MNAAALSEALMYHNPDRSGWFAVLVDRKQTSYRLADLPSVIEALPDGRQIYLSQGEFRRPCRQLVHLWRLPVLFADLEMHKTDMVGRPPEQQAQAVLIHCDDHGIPRPSLINFSGQGLHVKWLLTAALLSAALPRWNAVESELLAALVDFAPDRGAKSGSQCLRVVRSINPKSGLECRTVYQDGRLWDFETLCREVLPVDRAELAKRREKKGKASRDAAPPRRRTDSNLWKPAELWWNRLEDVRRLIDHRGWQHGVPERYRNNFLLVAACAVAWGAKPQKSALEAEIKCLAREFCPSFTPADVRASTSSVICAARAGRRARYTNARLVELLDIQPDEQPHLKTLVDPDERKRRRQEHDRQRNRKGDDDRATRRAKSASKAATARALKDTGLTYRQIAESMGTTVDAVDKLLRRSATASPPSPFPLGVG